MITQATGTEGAQSIIDRLRAAQGLPTIPFEPAAPATPMQVLRRAMLEQQGAEPHPEMVILREEMRARCEHELCNLPLAAATRVKERLEAYAECQNVRVAVRTKWGVWSHNPFEDDDELSLVLYLDVTDHVWRPQRHAHGIGVHRQIDGASCLLPYMEELAVDWGKSVIDKLSRNACVVLGQAQTDLLDWLSGNLEHGFDTLLDIDPFPRKHWGYDGDVHYPYTESLYCLKIDDEADRVLFRMRWS